MQAGPLLYYITRPSIRKAPLSRNSTIKVAHMSMGNPWLWSCFYLGLGLLLGSVLYRSDFCMAGILRDVFLFRDFTLLRHLFLAVMLCTFFFLMMREAGILPSEQPQTFGGGSLLGVLGGVIFGIGMVLAGGCVLSTLYKIGGGNLAHGLAFAGIIIGSLLYAELFPLLWAAEQHLAFGSETTLMQLWPRGARTALWLAIGGTAALCAVWQRQGKWRVYAAAEGYLQPWRVAVALALLNLAAYAFSGWPLGISTAYAKVGAFLQMQLAPGHTAGLEYFSQTSLTVVAGTSILSGGSGPQIDLYVYTEVMLMLGVFAGGLFNALLLHEFRLSGWPPLRQGLAALGGGILLAMGARMAGGCNIKHLLGGLPLLSIQSFLFLGGLLAGVWIGVLLLPKIIYR
jgi:uncharacterized protein